MTGRRGVVIVLILGLVAGFFLWRRAEESPPTGPGPANIATSQAKPVAPAALSPEERRRILENNPEARIADDLNLPGGDIRSDMSIVGSMLAAYRSIYPGKGNPVGDNRDIVATLLGGNRNGIIFLRRDNRALNADGELCDRWGTPFFFHAESGTRMEIRSAGPDRVMRTVDDAVMTP